MMLAVGASPRHVVSTVECDQICPEPQDEPEPSARAEIHNRAEDRECLHAIQYRQLDGLLEPQSNVCSTG
jgi:hypothetical protein